MAESIIPNTLNEHLAFQDLAAYISTNYTLNNLKTGSIGGIAFINIQIYTASNNITNGSVVATLLNGNIKPKASTLVPAFVCSRYGTTHVPVVAIIQTDGTITVESSSFPASVGEVYIQASYPNMYA